MFERKCSLCGGKLDGKGICTECGLDNTKSDKSYRTEQHGCDDQPLTHVHTEATMEEGDRKRKTIQKKPAKDRRTGQEAHPYPAADSQKTAQNSTPDTKPKKPRKQKRSFTLVSFLFLLLIFVSYPIRNYLRETDLTELIQDKWESISEDGQTDEDEWEEPDPYENVTREIPEEGSEASYTLNSGCYIVGVHIPEGIYQADMADDFDTIRVEDPGQSIYLYEYRYLEEDGTCYLDDLRLYEGAVLYVESKEPAVLSTSNAQPMEKTAMENPLTQEYSLKGTVKAGEDFEPGVYDLELVSGEGYITFYMLMDEEYDYAVEYNLTLGEGFEMGTCYRNLVIPEGAELRCGSDVELRLVPSEIISSTDYRSFYEND